MKTICKTVFVLFLSISSICSQAQSTSSPTFEQTVAYIIENTKGRVMYPGALDSYTRVRGYTLKDIKIDRNGKITFTTEQKNDYNDFIITFNVFDLVPNTEYPQGVIAKNFLVHFNGLNVSNGYGIVYATQNDALKVARAFRHLRTVCEKPKNDLFSTPVAEEKKTLGKSETIEYINKNIITGLYLGSCNCYELEIYNGGLGKRGINDGKSSYFVESQSLNNSSYTVIAKSNRESCRTPSYFNAADNLVRGNQIQKTVELKISFEITNLVDFEILDINSDPKTKVLKLNFKPNSSKLSYSLLQDLNDINVWTPSSLKFRVLNENVEKLKKAFLHLQALVVEEKKKKEEEDPFGK